MNNWYVITGGPCSGKSSVLKVLEENGFKVIPEAARTWIDLELSKGKSIEEIRKNEFEFQEHVLQLKIKNESKLKKSELVFLDRGIPDSMGYYKTHNDVPSEHYLNAEKNCNYKKVFLLELLDYQKDYGRVESEELANKIQENLKISYEDLGIEVILVKKMSIEERVEFILENL